MMGKMHKGKVFFLVAASCIVCVLSMCTGCTKTNKPKAQHENITRLDTRGLINYPKV
jgi:hypothetical protein